ncbi:MAG: peptidyl-prolyl cis-trans isomerase [Planctomycetota bacterium]
MKQRTTLTTAVLLAASLAFVGCERSWLASDNEPKPVVQPDDFFGEAQASNPDTPSDDALVSAEGSETDSEDDAEPATNPRTDQALPVDAMVGHINGEAVFADQIFDVNLIAQLESFGRRFERDEFRNNAGPVIQDRLQGIIINKLILGEAERNLKDAQRRGIEGRIQAEREELLRFYGQGSLAKAKAEFRKARDKELEEYLIDFREELVISNYIRSKVMPKIVVNQRDVERYYTDNIDRYQQPDQRIIRLMIAQDAEAAEQIGQQINKGVAFEKVASNPELNLYNATNGGVYNSGNPTPGNKVLSDEACNKALLKLDTGEFAGPIVSGQRIFFVQVVELTQGAQITLPQAQLEIEQKLRASQFERQALRFRMDLLRRGSYSDPAEMGNKLLDIAYARYDQ